MAEVNRILQGVTNAADPLQTELRPTLSVVVPVYNSAGNLAALVSRLEASLPAVAAQYELILVNDGSRDQSWAMIEQLVRVHPWVVGIELMRNYGQHNALLCGVRAAQHAVIVTMDDDLQHPPEELHKLLDKLAEGYDVVFGTPEAEQHNLWRDLASQATKLALRSAMGVAVAQNVSAFRAFRRPVLDASAHFRGSDVSIDVLLTWGTARFAAVRVRHDRRLVGASNYTFRKLITHALNMTTGFSTIPLQVSSLIGFFFTLFGIGVLIYVLGRYVIQGGSVPGFPFLASVVAIFSGAQLFALGIIGEYLARMHFRMMDRPSYVIRTTKGLDRA